MRDKKNAARRDFLKKSAYSVPTIVAMGLLSAPTQANASRFGNGNGQGNGNGHGNGGSNGNGGGRGNGRWD